MQHIETDRIGAILMDHFNGIGIIFQAFGHFSAIFGQNDPIDNHIFKSRLDQKGLLIKQSAYKTSRVSDPALLQ